MGVVRTTYLIDEQGIIIKANDKVKAAETAFSSSLDLLFIQFNTSAVLSI